MVSLLYGTLLHSIRTHISFQENIHTKTWSIWKYDIQSFFFKQFIFLVGKLFEQSSNDNRFAPWNKYSDLREPFLANRALILNEVQVQEFLRENGEDLNCQVFIHPGKYLPSLSNNYFVYQKDSPLREMIDYHVLKIKESGIFHLLVQKHFPPSAQDCSLPTKEIQLTDTVFVFALLASGLATSLIVLLLETFYKYSKISLNMPVCPPNEYLAYCSTLRGN